MKRSLPFCECFFEIPCGNAWRRFRHRRMTSEPRMCCTKWTWNKIGWKHLNSSTYSCFDFVVFFFNRVMLLALDELFLSLVSTEHVNKMQRNERRKSEQKKKQVAKRRKKNLQTLFSMSVVCARIEKIMKKKKVERKNTWMLHFSLVHSTEASEIWDDFVHKHTAPPQRIRQLVFIFSTWKINVLQSMKRLRNKSKWKKFGHHVRK